MKKFFLNVGNNKGFSMVEILATIVILGILTSVGIIAFGWILDLSEKRYYDSLKKNLVTTAENYYGDHRGLLPKAIGDSRKVLLQTLIDNNYLDEVLDYGKGNCAASSASYVKVIKYSKTDYLYHLYLDCPAFKIKESDYLKSIDIDIDFSFDVQHLEGAVSNIKIGAKDDNKIASYEYKIYKDGQNVFTSENIAAGYVESIDKTIKLEKYVPGNIRIVVVVYDVNGNKKIKEKEAAIFNDFVPECGSFRPVYNTWTNAKNANRRITVGCIDTKVECLKKEVTKTFNQELKIGYIEILGKNGKNRNCPVNVYIDRTDPICATVIGESTVWTKNDRTIKVNCDDATSGCEKTFYEKTYSTTKQTDKISIKDNAGNSKSCPVNVYVDKTPPRCGTITGDSTSWTNNNRTISVKCIDDDSGCKKSTYSKEITTSTKTTSITIEDNAGNTTVCPVNAYVDKEEPTCGSITGQSTSWTGGSRRISVRCNDTGGSSCARSSFEENFTSDGRYDEIIIRDNAGNTTSCSVNKYIDKTPPTCGTVTGESTSWTNGNRYITVYCNDSASGCKSPSYSQSFSSEGKYDSIRIYDNAGNYDDCQVNKYIDRTAPKCPSITSSVSPRTWTNKDVQFRFSFTSDTVKFRWYTKQDDGTISDWGLKNISDNVQKVTGEGYRKIAVKVYDEAGNASGYCGDENEYWIDKTPPYTPYLDVNMVKNLDGVPIKANVYGFCGSSCLAESSGNFSSIELQRKGTVCFTHVTCNGGPRTTSRVKCTYYKHYSCGGSSLTKVDNTSKTSHVSGIATTNTIDMNWANCKARGINYYSITDRAGNESQPLRIDILNEHMYTGYNLGNYFKISDYEWTPKVSNPPCKY